MENIIENNKLIGKFMGGLLRNESRVSMNPNEIWLPIHGTCRYDVWGYGNGKVLKYHCSWDWIIPVCQKCEELATNNQAIIHWIRNNHTIFDLKITEVKFEIVYKKVLEFINWYNTQNI